MWVKKIFLMNLTLSLYNGVISMKRCYVTSPLCSLSQFLETGADSHLLWNKPTPVPQYVFHTIYFPFLLFTQCQFISHFNFSHNHCTLLISTHENIFMSYTRSRVWRIHVNIWIFKYICHKYLFGHSFLSLW